MSAVTYPRPHDEPDLRVPLALPAPTRSRRGVYAAVAVIGVLLAASAAYIAWPNPAAPAPRTIIDGTAENVVVAYLHGDLDRLSELVAIELPAEIPRDQFYVRSASAVSIDETEAGWHVTVSVDHLRAVPGGFGNPATHHYLVTFDNRPTGPVVAGLPARVGPPQAPPLQKAPLPAAPDDPVTSAAFAYLAWLLTGTEGTYTGSQITPAPFVSVVIVGMQRVETDWGVAAVVAVVATNDDGLATAMHYPLELTDSGGVWRVIPPGS